MVEISHWSARNFSFPSEFQRVGASEETES
jgi:hypothetical protein